MHTFKNFKPSKFRDDPSHGFLNTTEEKKPKYWNHFPVDGNRYLHVATEDEDFRFDSIMLIGGEIEHVLPEAAPTFATVAYEFDKCGRHWIVGILASGEREIYCRLPSGHGLMLKV